MAQLGDNAAGLPADIFQDLVEKTPGAEGKWFAAAKDAELFDEAIELASVTPYCYEITSTDVLDTYSHTMTVDENAGSVDETKRRVHELVAAETLGGRFVTKILQRHLEPA